MMPFGGGDACHLMVMPFGGGAVWLWYRLGAVPFGDGTFRWWFRSVVMPFDLIVI